MQTFNVSRFGINPDLPVLRDLYNAGDLAFHANVGVLFDEVTQDNWQDVTKTQLFGHNTQIKDAQTIDPYESSGGTGVLGELRFLVELYVVPIPSQKEFYVLIHFENHSSSGHLPNRTNG